MVEESALANVQVSANVKVRDCFSVFVVLRNSEFGISNIQWASKGSLHSFQPIRRQERMALIKSTSRLCDRLVEKLRSISRSNRK